MDRSLFLLAQFGRKIELVSVGDRHQPVVGLKFERMPGRVRELWTVTKLFKREEHDQMVALATLMGISALKKLFEMELSEPTNLIDRVVTEVA